MVVGRVHVRHDDLAHLAAGARDEDDAAALGDRLGHRPAGADRLVIGVGVDGHEGRDVDGGRGRGHGVSHAADASAPAEDGQSAGRHARRAWYFRVIPGWDVQRCTVVGRHRRAAGGTTGSGLPDAVGPTMTDMIERVSRRIVAALGRPDEPADEAVEPAVPLGRIVEFLAYGDDCLLAGRLRLQGDRLTDQLNEHDEYEIVDLVAERLSDGLAAESPGAPRCPP